MEEQEDKKEHMSAIVKQEQVAPLTLEDKRKENIVKVSVELEEDFKQQLVDLLKIYKDVFAWFYSVKEGKNPKFYL